MRIILPRGHPATTRLMMRVGLRVGVEIIRGAITLLLAGHDDLVLVDFF